MANCSCGCGGKNVLIYSCSGACDTAEISDLAARKLRSNGVGKMYCLAGIGANLTNFIEQAKAADLNVVIDGCAVGCGKKIFEGKGAKMKCFAVTDFGMEKGKTPVTPENVQKTVEGVKKGIGC
ncbi:MAG: putative zinc-binding protein [Candidatus Firestonebacteria bacterium]